MPSSAIGAGAARYSRPLTRTRPVVGSSRPAIIRIVVDLPAPFGPRKPVTTPGWTTKSSPATASFSPYRLLRFSTSIIACSLIGNAGNSGTPPTLGITRPARHRPSGHKPSRPPMPQGLSAHRPTAYPARREASTMATGHVPQPPPARARDNAAQRSHVSQPGPAPPERQQHREQLLATEPGSPRSQ